jgi:ribosome maturation factor RimP
MPPAPAGKQAAQIRAHLLELLGPLVTAEGYDLEDVTVTAAGRRNLIRVIIDADGGVDLDAVATISRAASDALDAADGSPEFSEPYVLEVSSPGVDRPLTERRHWQRALGRLVQVQHVGRTTTGRVLETTESGVVLEVADKGKKPVRTELPWAELGPGKVQVEFNRKGIQPGIDDIDIDTGVDDEDEED